MRPQPVNSWLAGGSESFRAMDRFWIKLAKREWWYKKLESGRQEAVSLQSARKDNSIAMKGSIIVLLFAALAFATLDISSATPITPQDSLLITSLQVTNQDLARSQNSALRCCDQPGGCCDIVMALGGRSMRKPAPHKSLHHIIVPAYSPSASYLLYG